MAKFCSKCGSPLDDNSVFCSNCGTPAVPSAPPAAPQVPAAPVAASNPPAPPAPPASAYPAGASKPNDRIQALVDKAKANPKLLIIPCAILVGVLVLTIILSSVVGSSRYTSAIDTYVDMIMGDAGAIGDMAPAAFWDYMEEEQDTSLKDLKKEYKEQYEMIESMMEAQFGKNVKISYKVEDSDEFSKKELKKIQEALEDSYDMDLKVSAGYELELEMTIKGSEDKETNTMECCVLKIGGKWYMVELYEYNDEYSVDFFLG